MPISDNIVEYEVENYTLKREAIANGDPSLNQYWPIIRRITDVVY